MKLRESWPVPRTRRASIVVFHLDMSVLEQDSTMMSQGSTSIDHGNRQPRLHIPSSPRITVDDHLDELDVDASIPSTPFEAFPPDTCSNVVDSPTDEHRAVVEDVDADEETKSDDSTCRICLGGRDEEPELGRLISPCLCAGSMRVSLEPISEMELTVSACTS
jgi:hypothetical protein